MSEKENKKPGAMKRAANLATAIAKHAKDGFVDVSLDEYIERINTCNKCPLQKNGICEHENCGCILSRKAWWRSENCPINKWPKQQ